VIVTFCPPAVGPTSGLTLMAFMASAFWSWWFMVSVVAKTAKVNIANPAISFLAPTLSFTMFNVTLSPFFKFVYLSPR
jgi:hypothetical protein